MSFPLMPNMNFAEPTTGAAIVFSGIPVTVPAGVYSVSWTAYGKGGGGGGGTASYTGGRGGYPQSAGGTYSVAPGGVFSATGGTGGTAGANNASTASTTSGAAGTSFVFKYGATTISTRAGGGGGGRVTGSANGTNGTDGAAPNVSFFAGTGGRLGVANPTAGQGGYAYITYETY
jgi:hypothetical protein